MKIDIEEKLEQLGLKSITEIEKICCGQRLRAGSTQSTHAKQLLRPDADRSYPKFSTFGRHWRPF